MAKQVLGIRTVYPPELNKGRNIHAVLLIDFGPMQSNQLFVSTPELRHAIERFKLFNRIDNVAGKQIGYTKAEFIPETNALRLEEFFPFGEEHDFFSKTRVQEELEYWFKENAEKRFNKINFSEEFQPSKGRLSQLSRRWKQDLSRHKNGPFYVFSFKEEKIRLWKRIVKDREIAIIKRAREKRLESKRRLAELMARRREREKRRKRWKKVSGKVRQMIRRQK